MSQFNELIEFIRAEVNKGLKRMSIPDEPRYLYDPIRYTLKGKGKRFRPILVHLSGRANNVDPDALMNMALAVELLHNFTLVHDDIMDNDTIRHGQETVHSKWDHSSAILAGDGIYTFAQIILSNLPDRAKDVSSYFNKTTMDICEGQALDKQFENDHGITEEQYLEMTERKTGSLLGAAAALPAIYNGENEMVVNQYDQFGRALGIGFQIHDDLLEITAEPETMGKSLGSDIIEGKQTMMVIKARNHFSKKWKELISDSANAELINNIHLFFMENGIEDETRSMARLYFTSAREALEKLNGVNTDELFEFVHLVENRTY